MAKAKQNPAVVQQQEKPAAALVKIRWGRMTKEERRQYSRMMNAAKRKKAEERAKGALDEVDPKRGLHAAAEPREEQGS